VYDELVVGGLKLSSGLLVELLEDGDSLHNPLILWVRLPVYHGSEQPFKLGLEVSAKAGSVEAFPDLLDESLLFVTAALAVNVALRVCRSIAQ
jgi:hypothetical protein